MAATRLSITIPDELAERLEPYRDRMNISKVCAQAIEEELSNLAVLPVELEELAETIMRLRMEKAETEQEDYSLGYEWGQEWVKVADYAELVSYEAIPARREPMTWDDLPDYVKGNLLELQGWEQVEVISRDKFAEGWLDGALAVWQVIRNKV